ncbi:hypothetical protein [Methylobacterium oxalidis]|uniref:Uncharacterized protein n=1 Tax=Methylobacterium oxalidis TaxID=944322 RepID=A0A512J5K3_9HYPH|nr:hypothetical protein MOX02_32280 [Methylobacterium oxalidis]GLS66392.1 hypothetical protein GCM10007888_47750 [Methylobacterium oxalidis]
MKTKTLYRERRRIEVTVNRHEDVRRIATHDDKRVRNDASAGAAAAAVAFRC